MKFLRPAIIVIFVIVTIIFSYNWYQNKKAINTIGPEIQIDSEQIDVSVKAEEKDLLKGIIAMDDKDGDLTGNIIIESISQFVDKKKHICNITYAVADSDNNVSKKTRKIRYKDYKSPRFTLSQPLCFDIGSDIRVVSVIGATDEYDGDISSRVKILSSTIRTDTAGTYTITAQVSNSLGDTVKLRATVVIRQRNNLSPVINLKKNIVYIKKDADFKPEDYIKSVEAYEGEKIASDKVKVVSSSVNSKKAGCYSVEYSVTDSQGNEGNTYLTVVVEE